MTAIIIDDELKGRVALRQKLIDYCADIKLVGEANDGTEGLALIEKVHPNIVFLDIEMPQMGGFEMLQSLHFRDFHLIFTTAYDQYAIKAIKYAAFDYLLKPVDISELQSAIAKVKEEIKEYNTFGKLELLRDNFETKTPFRKIAIPSVDGLLFFNLDDIVHFEAQSNYTIIYFINRPRLTVARTLKDFEDLLPPNIFMRVHHSHIVNLQYIKRYIKGDGGQIELQNGAFIDVARSRKEEFLKLIR